MADILIVNRYGVFHLVPERLFDTVASQGGRRATPEEQLAHQDGKTRLGGAEPVVAAPAQTAAPWADYDSLNAEQVAARLRALPADQVSVVLAYESANKARKTILDAAQRLLAPSEA